MKPLRNLVAQSVVKQWTKGEVTVTEQTTSLGISFKMKLSPTSLFRKQPVATRAKPVVCSEHFPQLSNELGVAKLITFFLLAHQVFKIYHGTSRMFWNTREG